MTPPRKLSMENTEMDISVPSVLFSVAKCSHNHSSNRHNIILNSIRYYSESWAYRLDKPFTGSALRIIGADYARI
jgi:hypothetical protein